MSTLTVQRLHEAPEHKAGADLEFLAAYVQRLAVARDFESVVETALAGLIAGLEAEAAALYLLHEDGSLVCRGAIGGCDQPGRHVSPNDGVLGECLRRCMDSPIGATAGAESGAPISSGAGLYAPLTTAGVPIGVVAVHGPSGLDGGITGRTTILLQSLANSAALALANAHLSAELVQQELVQRDVRLAAEIQRSLLPRPGQDDLPVYGHNRPVRLVSGDFFDYFTLRDQRIAFALGDVSGKGINAALLMSKAASLFRCLGKRTDDPSQILSILNHELHETSTHGMFVTMVAGVYEPATGVVRFANAGHEPPLLRKRDRSYRTIPAAAPPLGIVADMEFPTDEIALKGGELYIFSDGLLEFQYGDDEELGVDGLIQLVEGLTHLPLGERLRTLLETLDREGWELRDDLTVLAVADEGGRTDD